MTFRFKASVINIYQGKIEATSVEQAEARLKNTLDAVLNNGELVGFDIEVQFVEEDK